MLRSAPPRLPSAPSISLPRRPSAPQLVSNPSLVFALVKTATPNCYSLFTYMWPRKMLFDTLYYPSRTNKRIQCRSIRLSVRRSHSQRHRPTKYMAAHMLHVIFICDFSSLFRPFRLRPMCTLNARRAQRNTRTHRVIVISSRSIRQHFRL